MSDHDVRTGFREHGFTTLRGFVDPREVGALRDAVHRAADEDEVAGNPLTKGGMRFASNVFRESATLQAFLASDAVVDLVRQVCGDDMWVRWDQAVWKEHGAPHFPWHQDNGYTGLDAAHVQLWVALTAMDESNGGLLVAPGRHTKSLEHWAEGGHMATTPPPDVEAISADAGDVILFSSFLPHATTPNRSGASRLAYVAEFLPLAVADRSVPSPHYVVARGGTPRPAWTDLGQLWGLSSPGAAAPHGRS